jgi:hypothetical protein
MANADTPIPKFKEYGEGEPIPPVDPEDIKRMCEYERTHSRVGSNGWQWLQGLKAAISSEADFSDVSSRRGMVETLARYNKGQLLAPWHQGEELHEAVFRIAAIFPLRYLKYKSYMIPGDEQFGFDPNVFVQKLIEETGIPHVWEPILTKISEGGRRIVTWSIPSRVPSTGERVPNSEREAKARARQILWHLWNRFSPFSEALSKKELPTQAVAQWVATSFAGFLLDNIDLVRQLEDSFVDPQHFPSDAILSELEQSAQNGF